MFLNRIDIQLISLVLFVTIVQSGKLRHDLEDKSPRIFKIIEKNNQIVLQKEDALYDEKELVQYLKNNADLEYRVNNILNKPLIKNNGRKKKLTKRIVDHGEETSDLQYDHKINTYFRPLVRLHRTKKLNNEESDKVDIKFKEKVPKWKIRPKNYEENKGSFGKMTETQHAVVHLIMIESEVKKLRSPLKEEFYAKLNKMLRDVEILHKDLLGSILLDELRNGAPPIDSVEDPELMAITVMPGFDPISPPQPPEEFPCAIYPDQPIWNYWTYAHTLHQDECPGDQVKIGDVCSRIPPHRK